MALNQERILSGPEHKNQNQEGEFDLEQELHLLFDDFEWEWSLINPPSYDAKIEFMVKRYTQYKLIKLYEKTASADSDRIAVDYSNVGTWTCTWYYTEEDYGTLYLSATVYAVE